MFFRKKHLITCWIRLNHVFFSTAIYIIRVQLNVKLTSNKKLLNGHYLHFRGRFKMIQPLFFFQSLVTMNKFRSAICLGKPQFFGFTLLVLSSLFVIPYTKAGEHSFLFSLYFVKDLCTLKRNKENKRPK